MLTELALKGFKSIRDQRIGLGRMNVLIGANGAGKSNLLDFFRLLDAAVGGRLKAWSAHCGGPHALLFEGPETTPEMIVSLRMEQSPFSADYEMRLVPDDGSHLQFAGETLTLQPADGEGRPPCGAFAYQFPHAESQMWATEDYPIEFQDAARHAFHLLNRCRVFQFHDTSAHSPLRTGRSAARGAPDAGHDLAPDGGNLDRVLERLHREEPVYYERIVETLRLIVPFFDTFVFREPDPGDAASFLSGAAAPQLFWRATDSSYELDARQFSDGTLRAIAIVVLLLQPDEDLPALIVLDEPELGLHPYTVDVIAGLLRSAATRSQIILSTQSVAFLEHFAPEDVLVVDRDGRESVFRRLDLERLGPWLENYSLGELWEKNVLGGRPA